MQRIKAVIPSKFIKNYAAKNDTSNWSNSSDDCEYFECRLLLGSKYSDHIISHPELNSCHSYKETGNCKKLKNIVWLAQNVKKFLLECVIQRHCLILINLLFVPTLVFRQFFNRFFLWRWHRALWIDNNNFVLFLILFLILDPILRISFRYIEVSWLYKEEYL